MFEMVEFIDKLLMKFYTKPLKISSSTLRQKLT